MAVVSDSNILSSLAAAGALDLLFQLFYGDKIFIPKAVEQELLAGLEYGATHLQRIIDYIQAENIQVLSLSSSERSQTESLPRKLHAGEREGIVLCQRHGHLFLSNDKQAIRYCQSHGIKAANLEALLRSIWIQRIRSQEEVKALIQMMQDVENLTLHQEQFDKIFAPRRNRI